MREQSVVLERDTTLATVLSITPALQFVLFLCNAAAVNDVNMVKGLTAAIVLPWFLSVLCVVPEFDVAFIPRCYWSAGISEGKEDHSSFMSDQILNQRCIFTYLCSSRYWDFCSMLFYEQKPMAMGQIGFGIS